MRRPVRQLRSSISRLVREETTLLIGLLVVAVLILGFVLIADEVLEGDLAAFDRMVFMALRSDDSLADAIGPPWFEEMVRDVTALGSMSLLSLLLVTLVGYLVLIDKRETAWLMAAAVLGGMLVSNVLKIGFDRPRPDIPHAARVFTASFPSAHATLSATAFLTIGILLARITVDRHLPVYFMTIAVLLTVLVGLSRIYLGMHYTSDVLAGWIIGSAWAILCWAVAVRLQKQGVVDPAGYSGADGALDDRVRPD